VRRIYRWDARFVLGLLALFGRRIFRFLVIEEDGHLVATTLLTLPARAGFVSMVVVDPAYRRRGLARTLVERARAFSARAGRPYVALDVLEANTPARTLYEALGYRPLRELRRMAWEPDRGVPTARSPHVRPFRRADAAPLAEILRRSAPPAVEEVLPVSARSIGGWGVARALLSEEAGWVVDRGRGPEAYLSVVRSEATTAMHCSAPIVAESTDPNDVAALVGMGLSWCTARGAPRVLAEVAVANARGRAALEGGGFRDALALWTLYRPSG